MNMSDVFKLPVCCDTWNLLTDADDNEFAKVYSKSEAFAAAHAINCHDDLVDALQALMDWQIKNVDTWHHPTWDNASRAIKKSRGEL